MNISEHADVNTQIAISKKEMQEQVVSAASNPQLQVHKIVEAEMEETSMDIRQHLKTLKLVGEELTAKQKATRLKINDVLIEVDESRAKQYSNELLSLYEATAHIEGAIAKLSSLGNAV